MTRWQKFTAAVASFVIAAGFVFTASVPSVAQQRPSEEEMLKALRPPPKTRSLTGQSSRGNVEERRFINSIRGKTRQLSLGERQRVSEIAKSKPNIDLEIYFEYNSSDITAEAEPELMKLGRVLTSADLKGGVFLIGGHTDGKGGATYNQGLSERRAAAVKQFLQERFEIADDVLVTAGYGKEELKNADDPFAAENRRVQIANLDQNETAQR